MSKEFDSSVIMDHRPQYQLGRADQRHGKPNTANPFAHGDKRTAWYVGWYDSYFFRKYGEPWPAS